MRCVMACIVTAAAVAAQPVLADDFVRPSVQWDGTVQDAKKEKAKPASGAITEREAFGKLWTAWQVGKEIPFINFDSYFVVVVAGPKGNTLIHLMVDEKGGGGAVVKNGVTVHPVPVDLALSL